MDWRGTLFRHRLRRWGLIVAIRSELRPYATGWRRYYLNKVWGMHIGKDCQISFSAMLDKTNPSGILYRGQNGRQLPDSDHVS